MKRGDNRVCPPPVLHHIRFVLSSSIFTVTPSNASTGLLRLQAITEDSVKRFWGSLGYFGAFQLECVEGCFLSRAFILPSKGASAPLLVATDLTIR